MKKITTLIIALLLTVTIFTSCEKEDPINPCNTELQVLKQNTIYFSEYGGTIRQSICKSIDGYCNIEVGLDEYNLQTIIPDTFAEGIDENSLYVYWLTYNIQPGYYWKSTLNDGIGYLRYYNNCN